MTTPPTKRVRNEIRTEKHTVWFNGGCFSVLDVFGKTLTFANNIAVCMQVWPGEPFATHIPALAALQEAETIEVPTDDLREAYIG